MGKDIKLKDIELRFRFMKDENYLLDGYHMSTEIKKQVEVNLRDYVKENKNTILSRLNALRNKLEKYPQFAVSVYLDAEVNGYSNGSIDFTLLVCATIGGRSIVDKIKVKDNRLNEMFTIATEK